MIPQVIATKVLWQLGPWDNWAHAQLYPWSTGSVAPIVHGLNCLRIQPCRSPVVHEPNCLMGHDCLMGDDCLIGPIVAWCQLSNGPNCLVTQNQHPSNLYLIVDWASCRTEHLLTSLLLLHGNPLMYVLLFSISLNKVHMFSLVKYCVALQVDIAWYSSSFVVLHICATGTLKIYK